MESARGARTVIVGGLAFIRPLVPSLSTTAVLLVTPRAITQFFRTRLGDWEPGELAGAAIGVSVGVVLTLLVYRLARRMPWLRPFRLWFALMHLVAAPASGLAWFVLTTSIERLTVGPPVDPRAWMVVVGSYVCAVVAGISYAVEATARAARTEAAEAQLSALRTQLHLPFSFNALHAVVQLVPIDPARAAEAAELVPSLLRVTVEAGRDEVTLGDEWALVSRYLAVEHVRFGERLRVSAEVDPDLLA